MLNEQSGVHVSEQYYEQAKHSLNDKNHVRFMEEAISLAGKGKWHTAPNPCVGAALVYEQTVVAIGYHKACGQAHAEVECLMDAIKHGIHKTDGNIFSNPLLMTCSEQYKSIKHEKNISFADCTLYVTLEPCNHEGKTPPCSQALVESGIKNVVIGTRDPNENARGGLEYIKEHGINVVLGVLEEKCKALLEDFLVWTVKKRPYIILKMATSLDGRIGPSFGGNHRISGEASSEVLMQLREKVGISGGAVMVGAQTLIKDNPKLTARTNTVQKQPRAVFIGSRLPVVKSPNLADDDKTNFYCFDERPNETILYCSMAQSVSPMANALKKRGVKAIGVSTCENSSELELQEVLEDLFKNQSCPYILCEGGPKLGSKLLDLGLVDELIIYMAPIVMGDPSLQAVFMGRHIESVRESLRFQIIESKVVGQDLHIHLKPESLCLPD